MKRWVNSAGHALRGVWLFFRSERNARIELTIALVAICLAVIFQLPLDEWCILLLVTGGVLSAEAFNSAIERLADLHSKELRSDIRDLKDLSAGAVMIMAGMALVTGLLLFGPRLYTFLFG